MRLPEATAFALSLIAALTSVGCGSRRAKHAKGDAHSGEQPTAPIFAAAPAGVDGRYLGLPLDATFQTFQGSSGTTVFPNAPVTRAPMNQMEHAVVFMDDTVGFAANARAWSFLTADIANTASHRFATYRAYQISAVDVLDDRVDGRDPPPGALFYASKIFYGHSFEAVMWGSESGFHAGVKAEFSKSASIGISAFAERQGLDYKFTGAGLLPRASNAIFAFTREEVTSAYSADGPAVPIFVEYRVLPHVDVVRDHLAWARSFKVEVHFTKFDVIKDSALIFNPTWSVMGFCEVNGKRTLIEDRWVLPPGTKVNDSQPAYPSSWNHVFAGVGARDIVTCGVEGNYSNQVGGGPIALSRLPVIPIIPGTNAEGTFEGANGSTKYRVTYTAAVTENTL
jgi:hypothetical protein